MVEIILKILEIVCATFIAYKLTTKEKGVLEETHPWTALFLELGALAIIFLAKELEVAICDLLIIIFIFQS